MKEQKRVPQLRFLDFQGNWEREKLISLTTNGFSNGAFNDPKKVGSGYRIINVKDMYLDNTINVDSLERLDLSENEFLKNKVEYGDIFFTRSSLVKEGIAFSNVNLSKDEDLTFDGHLIKMSPNIEKCNPLFLFYLFKNSNSRKQFIIRGKTATMTTIGQDDISDVVVVFPSLPEQQKIAGFLSAIDKKIAQLQQKKSLLEDYKKGVMQQIFFHELRFTQEDGRAYHDWEEKSLGEIGETMNGLTGKTKENFGTGKPYVQYKQIFDSSKIIVDDCGLVDIGENERQTKVNFGDVFFTTSSETPNEIGTASVLLDEVEEMYLNSFCFGLRINQDVLKPSFAQFLFRSPVFRKKMIPLAQGSTRYNISKSSFLKLKVELPSIEEQAQIANFLSAIDTKIAVVQTQIEQTQTFKKGLLQQMFV